MLIQFWHSSSYDYQKELYIPIKESIIFKQNKIILPHDNEWEFVNSKDSLKKVDIFFSEVSYPSIWLWIELWFANIYWVKIVCFYKKWIKVTGSLSVVCNDFFEYSNSNDMIEKINKYINSSN